MSEAERRQADAEYDALVTVVAKELAAWEQSDELYGEFADRLIRMVRERLCKEVAVSD